MALPGLLARLNCPGYKNWMKAGHCLLMLHSRLQGYIDGEMRAFHRQLADRITGPKRRRKCQCRAWGKQFQPGCPVCAQWKELILAHHNNRNGEIHWGNSDPSLWPTHHWEVAKVYMPRGQGHNGPQQCDAAALLNLINTCDYFRIPNISRVREIIRCRNELMHSSDMMVSVPWLKAFGQKLHDLITELKDVPGLVREGERIQEVLRTDWSIEDLDMHEVDGPGKVQLQGNFIRQSQVISLSPYEVERQLIEQLIHELYVEIEEQGSITKEIEEKVSKMKTFLSQNEDLRLAFQTDLLRLEYLWKSCVPFNADGWTHTQRSAAFFVAFLLVLLIALLLYS